MTIECLAWRHPAHLHRGSQSSVPLRRLPLLLLRLPLPPLLVPTLEHPPIAAVLLRLRPALALPPIARPAKRTRPAPIRLRAAAITTASSSQQYTIQRRPTPTADTQPRLWPLCAPHAGRYSVFLCVYSLYVPPLAHHPDSKPPAPPLSETAATHCRQTTTPYIHAYLLYKHPYKHPYITETDIIQAAPTHTTQHPRPRRPPLSPASSASCPMTSA